MEQKTITALTEIFSRYSGCPASLITPENHLKLASTLQGLLKERRALEIVLPGFPFKSTNTIKKVLGDKPDFGEYSALKTLSSLCKAVAQYTDVRLSIVSDGHVFNDLLRIEDKTVDAYFQHIEDLCDSPHIRFLRLHDFFGKASANCHRETLLRGYADTMTTISSRIKNNEDDRILYCGLSRFMQEDQTIATGESKKHFKNHTKQLARLIFQRSQAYSRLIEESMPHAFRLSIHPRPSWTEKTPIRLVPSNDRWATPWHNVPVYDETTNMTTLMHREYAEAHGCRLEHKNGKPWRFIAP